MNNSEKMVASIQQQDLIRANKYFHRALEQDDAETLMDLAAYLESIGFFPQAKTIYEQLVSNYPEFAINLAQIAHEDGHEEEAFAYLEEIAPDSPYYVEALVVKAELYQSEGLTDVAKEKLEEASQLSDDPVIVFGLSELEMELGLYPEAIAHYASLDNREIYELAGISTYQRIGVAYASLGKFEAAIEFLEKAIELEYEDQTLYELAVLLFDQEEYQKANLYFKQLDTLNPDFEGYEYVYAQSLHAEHQLEEALHVAEKGLEKNPYDGNLQLLASQYAYENHDTERSERYLLSAKEQLEDLNEVTLRLTNLYLEEERFEDVVALDQEDLENVLAKWNIAKAYKELEKDERAEALYQDLLADLAANPEFLEEYALYMRELGKVEDAKQALNAYLQLVPDDLSIQELAQSLSLGIGHVD